MIALGFWLWYRYTNTYRRCRSNVFTFDEINIMSVDDPLQTGALAYLEKLLIPNIYILTLHVLIDMFRFKVKLHPWILLCALDLMSGILHHFVMVVCHRHPIFPLFSLSLRLRHVWVFLWYRTNEGNAFKNYHSPTLVLNEISKGRNNNLVSSLQLWMLQCQWHWTIHSYRVDLNFHRLFCASYIWENSGWLVGLCAHLHKVICIYFHFVWSKKQQVTLTQWSLDSYAGDIIMIRRICFMTMS